MAAPVPAVEGSALATARLPIRATVFTDAPDRRNLSPYDDLVRRYADHYGFDWRLIVALMYQESQFDPEAVSPAGAQGLMQVMPETGLAFGFEDLHEPEVSIHAGIHYLDQQRNRFEHTLATDARNWFALAAYHAGLERVRSARRRAEAMGLNPDRWFGHVEQAMLEMQQPHTGSKPKGGRHWAVKTVRYVRAIRGRYDAYRQHFPEQLAALTP
jgi:membrane-bound lytic murein transglycosylase F